MSNYLILRGLIVFIFSLYTGIIVHEFGHFFCGLLSAYSFSSFRVGPLILFRENERFRLGLSRNIGSGQCLMVPPKDPANFSFVLYNLGGVLFNFLFALVLLIFSAGGFYYIPLLVNLLLAVINAIPMRSFILTDGANLLEAMKSDEAARGLYTILYVNGEMMDGKRFRDFDEGCFTVDEGADLSNYFVANLFILEAARLEDMGRYDEFVELYRNLDLAFLPNFYKSLVKADLLYYYSFFKPDYEKAREIYEDGNLRQLLQLKLPSFLRISAAYEFFVVENKVKAVKLMKKAKKSAAKIPNKGARMMEMEYIQTLITQAREAYYAA